MRVLTCLLTSAASFHFHVHWLCKGFLSESPNLNLWFKISEWGSGVISCTTGFPLALVHVLLPKMEWGSSMPLFQFFSLGIHSWHFWLLGRSLAFGNVPLDTSRFPSISVMWQWGKMDLDLWFKICQEFSKHFWGPLAYELIKPHMKLRMPMQSFFYTIHHSIGLYKISQHLLNCHYEIQKLIG